MLCPRASARLRKFALRCSSNGSPPPPLGFSTSGKHVNYVKYWNGCLCHDPEEVSSAIFGFIGLAVEQIGETLIAIFWKCSWIVSFVVPKRNLLFSIWLSCKLRAIHELNGWKKVCIARIPAQIPLRSFFWHAEKWDDEFWKLQGKVFSISCAQCNPSTTPSFYSRICIRC